MNLVGDPDFFEAIMFAFFNITTLISVLIFNTENIFSGWFIFSWIIGGLVWFLIGMFLGWLSRNKETTEEKLRYIGKVIMFIALGLAILFILYAIINFILAISNDINLEGFWWFLMIYGLMLVLPLTGGIFSIGLIVWLISKYGFKRVIIWVAILLAILLILFGLWKLFEWIVVETPYLNVFR